MIDSTHYINGVEIDEPQGFSELILSINRDDNWQGIFFETSTKDLQFYGNGAALLKAEKEANGLAASATYRVDVICGETVQVIDASFDFGTYVENCGNLCTVNISIEQTGCTMQMRNRYEQPVDLQKTTAFNNVTLLRVYDGLDRTLELTAQSIALINEAVMSESPIQEIMSNSPLWTPDPFGDYVGYLAPALPIVRNESMGIFNASAIIDLSENGAGAPNQPPYPSFPTTTGTATLTTNALCDLDDTVVTFRLKGTLTGDMSAGVGAFVNLTTKLFRLPAGLDGTVSSNWVQEYSNALAGVFATGSDPFDTGVITVSLTVSQGDFIYWGVLVAAHRFSDINFWTVAQDPECFFKIITSATCEPTDTDASLVNEFGSRIIEAITDGCMPMKSDYYGRTDSEPYESDVDGCGSLRMLTNGLKIRNAPTTNHFCSLKDFFNGLRGIDNIGMGIEDNPNIPNTKWLRVEPVEYFYQDVKLISLPFVPEAKASLDPSLAATTINVGYKKWEVQKINGLDEYNSNKVFRTSLDSINQPIDITSNFVAGGYPIEVTRQQSFAVSGAADTSYDNETFIICVDRSGYDFIVEKDNISSPTNMFSPATAYNWRIRPLYNLMRWFKSIAQSYVNLSNTTSKLFFASGTGNYIASGMLPTYEGCRLEDTVMAENYDLSKDEFEDIADATPIYLPQTMQLTYPLSLADYLTIKANPYGYIEVQCGNGNFEKCFIKNIKYKVSDGEASFTLIKKWP